MDKKLELTKKGKIILAIVAVAIITTIACLIIFKGEKVSRISIEMVSPNEGVVIDDPILGMSTQLKIGKRIKLDSTIHPENHKKVKAEYVVEDENIAYVNDENMIVGKAVGKTTVYMQTTDGKVISNKIEINIVE